LGGPLVGGPDSLKPPSPKKWLKVRKTKIAVHGRTNGSRSEIRPTDGSAEDGQDYGDARERHGGHLGGAR